MDRWVKSMKSRPWRRQLSIALNEWAMNCSPRLDLLGPEAAPLGIDRSVELEQGTGRRLNAAQIQQIGPAVALTWSPLLVGVMPDQGLAGQERVDRLLPGQHHAMLLVDRCRAEHKAPACCLQLLAEAGAEHRHLKG